MMATSSFAIQQGVWGIYSFCKLCVFQSCCSFILSAKSVKNICPPLRSKVGVFQDNNLGYKKEFDYITSSSSGASSINSLSATAGQLDTVNPLYGTSDQNYQVNLDSMLILCLEYNKLFAYFCQKYSLFVMIITIKKDSLYINCRSEVWYQSVPRLVRHRN